MTLISDEPTNCEPGVGANLPAKRSFRSDAGGCSRLAGSRCVSEAVTSSATFDLMPIMNAMRPLIALLAFSYLIGCANTTPSRAPAREEPPALTLDKTLTDIARSSQITLWNPDTRRFLAPITRRSQITAVSAWIRAQPVVYDKRESKLRATGSVCGCLPWIIQSSAPDRSIAVHQHSIVLKRGISFRSASGIDLRAFRSHLLVIGVLKKENPE